MILGWITGCPWLSSRTGTGGRAVISSEQTSSRSGDHLGGARPASRRFPTDSDPGYMSRKIRKFRTYKFDSEAIESFDWCKICKRLVPSRLHDLHESKLSFVSGMKFIRSKHSNFSAHVSVVTDAAAGRRRGCRGGNFVSSAEHQHSEVKTARSVCSWDSHTGTAR